MIYYINKSPIVMLNPQKPFQPHNNGSLNKYIKGFISEVVEGNHKGYQNASTIIEAMNKLNSNDAKTPKKVDLNSSIIKTMSEYLNNIMDNQSKLKESESEEPYYIGVNDINSIALNVAPVDSNIKMRSPFVSKTKRYPTIKQSPGPGSYNLAKEQEQQKNNEKESQKAFGSTVKQRTHFLNVEKTPFGQPSFLDNPGVGHYYNGKKIPKRIEEEIVRVQKEKEQDDEDTNKPGFLGSSKRPWWSDLDPQEVGPGKYEVNIKNLNVNTTSHNTKKHKGNIMLFISTSPRF